MGTLFSSAFILGIISNLHCIGMCGPIVLAIPLNRESIWTKSSGILQYNLGRILTYSVLGGIVGFIGLGINFIGILQSLSIIAGIGIILYAWRKQLFKAAIFRKFNSNVIQKFTSKSMGKILRNDSPFKLFLLGMINGILPCGMVYTALITSIIAGNPLESSFAMLFFGLGTLPGMITIAFFANQIKSKFRSKINVALPYLVTIVGLLIVFRGLNLDIPYISPKVKINQKTKELKMDCCHKTATPICCQKKYRLKNSTSNIQH